MHPKMSERAIIISADPDRVQVDDAIRHLAAHDQLYWEVGFRIGEHLECPLFAFIHIRGEQVGYRARVTSIVPFSPEHFQDETLKPEAWRRDQADRPRAWKHALVISEIVPFSWNTRAFIKVDGSPVKTPPESYVRVRIPNHPSGDIHDALPPANTRGTSTRPVAERYLEDFVVAQLQKIEPGLRLEERQKSTEAGRLDLLCRDAEGRYVVVELKRTLGTDQVLGQILRYMGWLAETHGSERVRGIIVVAGKDHGLTYAAKAVKNVEVKEFSLDIR